MSNHHLRMPIVASILVAITTLVLKTGAYWLTGSVGLLSDAVESGVNLVAAVTALLSLWYSAKPVDSSHTYGHEKIEYFSSGLEGILIIVAAGSIGWYAVHRLIFGGQLESLGLGVMISLFASLLNLGVALWLLRVGRANHSIVLEADGHHLMTDVWTSVAVVVGLALVTITKIEIIDPIVALAMAVNILWTGFQLIRRSFNGLMDHALPEDEQAQVREAIEKTLKPGMTFHAMRTRQAGAHRFVDFHLLVPGRTTVRDSHAQSVQIERAVQQLWPRVEVVVHVEPIEEPASYGDSEVLAVEQEATNHAGQSGPDLG